KKSSSPTGAPAFSNPRRTPLAGSAGTVSTFSCRSPLPSSPRRTTSVNVPPTSTAIRMFPLPVGCQPPSKLLDGYVLEVIPEVARPAELDPLLGPPLRVAGDSEHDDAKAVAETLRRDRVARLRVDQRDQVGDA